jgi:hypothetical protein
VSGVPGGTGRGRPAGRAGGTPPVGRLNALSCPTSPMFCFAVGDLSPTSSADAPVIWERNGTVWNPLNPVSPAGGRVGGGSLTPRRSQNPA